MADNYCHFSEVISFENEGDRDWVKEHLEFYRKFQVQNDGNDLDFEEQPGFKEFDALCEIYGLEWDCEALDFEYDLSADDVHIYSEGFGNVDHAIVFMQEFLRQRDPEGILHLTWAFTCSKPRPGEFGGGAAFITAEKMEIIDLYEWVDKKRKAHDK